MKFDKNIGHADRAVRGVVGLVLLYLIVSGAVRPPVTYVLGLLTVIALFTAVTGSCCLYKALKLNTCRRK